MENHSAEPPGTPTSGTSPGNLRAEIVLIVAIGVGILGAMAVLEVFRSASREITALGIGLLVALALDPVLRATQRRFECSRAVGTVIVGSACVLAFGGLVLVLGSQAADQAGRFADELPATIEEFYSWPVIGERLEATDAVGDAERFVDELPSRIDADSISDIAGRIVGGLAFALLVLVSRSQCCSTARHWSPVSGGPCRRSDALAPTTSGGSSIDPWPATSPGRWRSRYSTAP